MPNTEFDRLLTREQNTSPGDFDTFLKQEIAKSGNTPAQEKPTLIPSFLEVMRSNRTALANAGATVRSNFDFILGALQGGDEFSKYLAHEKLRNGSTPT